MITTRTFLIWLGHMALAMLIFGLRPDFLANNIFMSGMLFALAMWLLAFIWDVLFDGLK